MCEWLNYKSMVKGVAFNFSYENHVSVIHESGDVLQYCGSDVAAGLHQSVIAASAAAHSPGTAS